MNGKHSPGESLPCEPSVKRAEDQMIAIMGVTTNSCSTLAERSQNAQSFQLGQIPFPLARYAGHGLTNAFVYGDSRGTRANLSAMILTCSSRTPPSRQRSPC